ncbi:hypothetical protein [Bartonella taylorii]|uniref:hypothetical protein n=1 Tax=Bartonella taylorii TaxID=33046 RepID=UPI0002F66F70|nr:hypothetical protein [Bartonella taylorii]
MALCFLMGYFVDLFARGGFAEFFNLCPKSHYFVVACSTKIPAMHHVVHHILVSFLGETFIVF